MADENSTSTRVQSNSVRIRKNIRHLSEQELNDLRNAFEGLYEVSTDGGNNDERGYQWIAGVHGLPIPIYCQHGTLDFPTWHRAYIYEFELRLQEQVPGVMLPYWDWTSDESIANGMPEAVTDRQYTDLKTGVTKPNPLYSAFSQATGSQTSRNPGVNSGLRQLKIQVEMAQRQRTYDRYSPALENPHGGLHVWVGGDMGSVPRAAYDPVFWLHHCNVDRLWFEWQREHGDSTVPQAQRDFVCTPFSYTGEQTLDTKYFNYSYVDSEAFTEVDLDDAANTTKPDNEVQFEVPVATMDYKHAFLELHGLSKTIESYQLNLYFGDGGNDNSPDDPDINAGYAESIFLLGHGKCAGGKGHCSYSDRPVYDKRPDHHLRAFNTFVDVTKALKRYSPKDKAKITIKAYDSDGNETTISELKFKGISIATHQ